MPPGKVGAPLRKRSRKSVGGAPARIRTANYGKRVLLAANCMEQLRRSPPPSKSLQAARLDLAP